jgi:hypothetical protein
MRNLFTTLFIIGLLVASCKKNGTGGESSISTSVEHHDLPIPGSRVYVKYGTKDFPGSDVSQYDASFLTDGSGKVTVEGLRYGDYYFYGVGYDSSINEAVTGGTSIRIKWSDRKENTTLVVPVTE